MSATVIIPTTGGPELRKAIESVLEQTHGDTKCYVVCDGKQYAGKVKPIVDDYLGNGKISSCFLPLNVGANGFYGHRVYAAFTHLIDTKYVLYLDQDNWFDKDHVKSCVEKIEQTNSDWSYSLRKIADKNGNYLCNDDCESLGKWPCFQNYNHIDTNCYCIKTEVAIRLASAWHGGWGQDRVFLSAISQHFPKYECTGEYSVNYRIDGNAGSVKPEFFEHGNKFMLNHFKGELPWRKKI